MVFRSNTGSVAHFGRDGHINEIHTRNMIINRGPLGTRRVFFERPDHSRVVVFRGGLGYVQHPFLFRGREFASRTYFFSGRPYALYYRRYPFRGVYLSGYAPYRYYSPAFYGWAYHPWGAPIRYSWGWAGNPWYGYYGGSYFTPYSVYPSASFWLTDYLIATSLQAAYLSSAGQGGTFAGGGDVTLSPEVKQAIADEVSNQLALENAESQNVSRGVDIDINSSGLPRLLSDVSPQHPHIFVVAGPISATDEEGLECSLNEGDVIKLTQPPPLSATSAWVKVLATTSPNLARGSRVSVSFEDLQEMQNHMRASIDQGLADLQGHQNGLPQPPPAALTAPVASAFAPIAPPPDPNVASELQQQLRDADSAQEQVLREAQQAQQSGGGSGASAQVQPEVRVGQTVPDVLALRGDPERVADAGSRRVYIYPDVRVTFVNGRVISVASL